MATLLVVGIILIGLFGYTAGVYLTLYKFSMKNTAARIATSIVTGSTISIATLYLAVVMLWPGI